MKNLIADIPIAPNGGFKGFGKLGLVGSEATNADITFTNFISSVIGVLSIVAIIWFVFIILSSGISFISSGGDKNSIESAKKKLTSGLIGLLITLLGILFLNLIGYLLGIKGILNIGDFINVISGNVVN